MSPTEPVRVLPPELLGQLSRALEASEPERAVREAWASCGMPQASCERFVLAAVRVHERARAREPRAPLAEVQLALGVLLIACAAHDPGEADS